MGKQAGSTVEEVTGKGFDALEDKVLDGLDAARKVAESAAGQGAAVQEQADTLARDLTEQVSQYIQEKPLQAAGIAFAAGAIATLLLTRR